MPWNEADTFAWARDSGVMELCISRTMHGKRMLVSLSNWSRCFRVGHRSLRCGERRRLCQRRLGDHALLGLVPGQFMSIPRTFHPKETGVLREQGSYTAKDLPVPELDEERCRERRPCCGEAVSSKSKAPLEPRCLTSCMNGVANRREFNTK